MAESIFSQIISGDIAGVVLHRDEHCMVLMDAFPMLPGHVLVIPLRPCVRLRELPNNIRDHLFRVATALTEAMVVSGLSTGDANLVVNDGRSSGQSVAHVHIHVVPRHKSDGFPFPALFTNLARKFIGRKASVAELQAVADRLRPHLVLLEDM